MKRLWILPMKLEQLLFSNQTILSPILYIKNFQIRTIRYQLLLVGIIEWKIRKFSVSIIEP